MMADIIVIGSLNMDLVVEASKFPVLGETVLGSGFMTAAGGKGANQAVAAARLGGNVAMVGCVGRDNFGQVLIDTLRANNVNTDNVAFADNHATGTAVIVVYKGDNFIVVDPGANSMLSVEMIDNLEELISKSSMVVVQLEIPLDTVERALKIAKKHGVKVLLNPAPAKPLTDELLSMVDIITPNESESELLTGIKQETIDDAKEAVRYIMKKGIRQAVITLGKEGAVYNSGAEIKHKGVPEVKAVDTTAAGDSFTGALAVALSQGKSIDRAVEFANMVGSITVTRKGAIPSLPTLEEVNRKLTEFR